MKQLFSLLKTQTLRDILITFIGLATATTIGFIYTIVLARTIGPESFGIYSAVTALATILYSVGDLGISSAIINFLPKISKRRLSYISAGFWIQVGVAILIFFIFTLISIFHQAIVPGSLRTDLILAGILAINYLFICYSQGVFTAEKRFWSLSFSQIIDSVIKITLVFFLLISSRLTVSSAIAANVISTLLALLITFGKELYAIKSGVEKEIYLNIFNFAKWIAISRFFSVFITRIDVVLLNLLSTSYHAGIYAASSRVSLLFAMVVSAVGSVINSRFSAFESSEKVKAYLRKLALLVSAISLVMVICAVLADPIISLVYGKEYLAAVPVFRLLTLSMIPFLFSLLTTPVILYTYNQTGFYAFVTAAQVTGIVVIDFLLIPSYTYFAPVIAMAATNVLVLAVSLVKINELLKRDPGEES